jgi:hypothetical protein
MLPLMDPFFLLVMARPEGVQGHAWIGGGMSPENRPMEESCCCLSLVSCADML